MNCTRYLRTGTAALFASALLIALNSSAVQAKTLKWHHIFGLVEAGNVVGVGTASPPTSGEVTGGAPWVVTSGDAEVNLNTGHVDFRVNGLVLAVGSASSASLFGLGIGTSAGVTPVKGTLVCNVSGNTTGGGGVSVEDNTGDVPLSFRGNASFSGHFVNSIPSVCTTNPKDTAFLIRIGGMSGFANLWIAAGGVLTIQGH